MKAITVQQPWAWAIIYGGKLVENRTQMTHYRGPLAIHAGKRWSERGARIVPEIAGPWQKSWTDPIGDAGPVPAGVLIGVVDLVDCHEEAGCCAPWGERTHHGLRRRLTHLVLENPRPLPEPIPAAGHVWLWNVDLDDPGKAA